MNTTLNRKNDNASNDAQTRGRANKGTTCPDNADALETQTKPEFHIDSDSAANWLLRKLANLDAEKERIQRQAAEMIADLDRQKNSLEHLYGAELASYCYSKLDGRSKTVRFLQGTCSFRTVPAGLKLDDLTAALVYAKSAALPVIETLEKLDTAAYREIAESKLMETGELLPGMTRTVEKLSFNYKFKKD